MEEGSPSQATMSDLDLVSSVNLVTACDFTMESMMGKEILLRMLAGFPSCINNFPVSFVSSLFLVGSHNICSGCIL